MLCHVFVGTGVLDRPFENDVSLRKDGRTQFAPTETFDIFTVGANCVRPHKYDVTFIFRGVEDVAPYKFTFNIPL